MIKPLTSLRFFFAVLVFLSHCNVFSTFFNQHLFSEAYVGVSFFFVLSGFIISYRYRKLLREKKISVQNFWVARIARVYPLHLLTLFAVILLGVGYQGDGTFVDFIKHFIPNFFLLQSFIPRIDYYFSFNAPSWSLNCEFLFYFLFPLLLYLPRKVLNGLCAFLIVCLPLGMFLTGEHAIKSFWYVNPLIRLSDFFVGYLLFLIFSGVNCSWKRGRATIYEIAAVCLFLAWYMTSDLVASVYRFSCYYWIPVFLLIYVFSRSKGLLSSILSNKWLVTGGDISFGFYLIHRIIIDVYKKNDMHFSVNIAVISIFIVVVTLSWLSHQYFEKPMRLKIKNWLEKNG